MELPQSAFIKQLRSILDVIGTVSANYDSQRSGKATVSARWLFEGSTDAAASKEMIMIRRIVLSLVVVAAVVGAVASQAEASPHLGRGHGGYGGYGGYGGHGGYYGGYRSIHYYGGPSYYYGGPHGYRPHYYGRRSFYGGYHGGYSPHGRGGISFSIGH